MTNRRIARIGGFGLIELLITLVIASLLMSIALPSYERYTQRARVAKAVGDIGIISVEITKFQLRNNDRLPDTLDELGIDIPADPWNRGYVYINIRTSEPGVGGLRKDKNLNPLNTDYDLYSVGKDGETQGPLSAKASHDDVLRASDGAYVGLGEDY